MSATAYTSPDAPFVKSSDTSVEAAKNLNTRKRDTDKWMIANFIRNRRYDGATREEIATALALSGDTVRPRVVELIAEGRIAEVTDRTRKTKSGRQAGILIALTTEQA